MARVRVVPPVAPLVPDDPREYARPPVYRRGQFEATTGPRDVARFQGPPSEVVTDDDITTE